MSQTQQIDLTINKLTKQQYESIQNPTSTDLYLVIDDNGISSADVTNALGYTPQQQLVSGTNIKTINNESLLGSGNITISSGTATDVQINGTSITSNGVANIVTNSTYNASSNKIATMSDLPSTANMQTTTNLVTSVSSSSTDSQYPSAKLFYDTCGDIETLINAL